MNKKIVFIGPNFGDLILEKNVLNNNFLEKLWRRCSNINSEMKFKEFILQLKKIEEKNKYYHEDAQFLTLIDNIEKDFDYTLDKNTNDRLLMFKKIVFKSMLDKSECIDYSMHEILGYYLSETDYVISYQYDLLVEKIMKERGNTDVYNDIKSFLNPNSSFGSTVLFKIYGSCNQIFKMAMMQEERLRCNVNLHKVIKKINEYGDISISLIGFNKRDKEFEDILSKLDFINKKTSISFFKPHDQNKKGKKYSYVKIKNGLNIKIVTTDLQTYLIDQLENKNYIEVNKSLEPL